MGLSVTTGRKKASYYNFMQSKLLMPLTAKAGCYYLQLMKTLGTRAPKVPLSSQFDVIKKLS